MLTDNHSWSARFGMWLFDCKFLFILKMPTDRLPLKLLLGIPHNTVCSDFSLHAIQDIRLTLLTHHEILMMELILVKLYVRYSRHTRLIGMSVVCLKPFATMAEILMPVSCIISFFRIDACLLTDCSVFCSSCTHCSFSTVDYWTILRLLAHLYSYFNIQSL